MKVGKSGGGGVDLFTISKFWFSIYDKMFSFLVYRKGDFLIGRGKFRG